MFLKLHGDFYSVNFKISRTHIYCAISRSGTSTCLNLNLKMVCFQKNQIQNLNICRCLETPAISLRLSESLADMVKKLSTQSGQILTTASFYSKERVQISLPRTLTWCPCRNSLSHCLRSRQPPQNYKTPTCMETTYMHVRLRVCGWLVCMRGKVMVSMYHTPTCMDTHLHVCGCLWVIGV